MRITAVNIVLALAAQSHARELATTSAGDAHDSAVVGQMASSAVDKLFDRAITVSALPETDLDGTTLVKAGQLAVPTYRRFPVSAVITPSLRTSSLPYRTSFGGRPGPNFIAHAVSRPSLQSRGPGVIERPGSRRQRNPEAEADTASVDAPYNINYFVDGDMSHADGTNPRGYMESKIMDALKNNKEKIDAVDVRLKVEGHKPKTYRFEVTVKGPKGSTGTAVVSKSKHERTSFPEAVDDMHDTLKRVLSKEKEKRVGKVRQTSSLSESGIIDEGEPIDAASDDEYYASKSD
jgi:ribosomal subunit interface protein